MKDDPKMRSEKETVTNVKTNQKIYFPQREKNFLNFFSVNRCAKWAIIQNQKQICLNIKKYLKSHVQDYKFRT